MSAPRSQITSCTESCEESPWRGYMTHKHDALLKSASTALSLHLHVKHRATSAVQSITFEISVLFVKMGPEITLRMPSPNYTHIFICMIWNIVYWYIYICTVFNKKKSSTGSWQSRRRPCCGGRRSLPRRPKGGGTPKGGGGFGGSSPRKCLIFWCQ